MPAENKIAPNIQLALDYSRSFATAKPNIGLTEKEHIEGLANLLERTATENQALQARLTVQDQRVDELLQELRILHATKETPGEEVLWDVLDAAVGVITRRAYPHALESEAHNAGVKVILARRAGLAATAPLNPTAEAASHEQ